MKTEATKLDLIHGLAYGMTMRILRIVLLVLAYKVSIMLFVITYIGLLIGLLMVRSYK